LTFYVVGRLASGSWFFQKPQIKPR